MEIIEINTEFIKLDQLLKFAAIVTNGSEAKMLILDGMVRVNGEICTQRNKKSDRLMKLKLKIMESCL